MDPATIAAALLHDVVDDTPVTLKDIEKKFGSEVAFLVDGVSKLGRIKYRGMERHAENLRKMLVATAKDVRVIIIKFADRLHNIKTLEALPKRKQHRIALETLEIYAPIATRLGVFELARQLEDFAFPFIYPKEYEYVKKESEARSKEAEKYLKKLSQVIERTLKKSGTVPISIDIRVKHLYSLWKKLEKYDHNWDAVNDLMAVRIIVRTIEDCYKTLGIIHKLWRPLPGRIKDFIALPKPNGYQSLHTTIFAVGGKKTEIQIRTPAMHENAEFGVAAHWQYKNKAGQSKKALNKAYDWVQKLQEWKKDTSNTEDLLDNLKIDVFTDRIFVFTPTGDAIDLPSGATPVDFAYNIHSGIGDTCAGALVNGKMVALHTELKNGDIVEVITSKNKTPSQTWLTFVKTSSAKIHIKRWFRKQNEDESRAAGLRLVNNELKAYEGKTWTQIDSRKKKDIIEKFNFKNENALMASVGRGDMSVLRIIQNITEHKVQDKVIKTTQKKLDVLEKNTGIIIAGASGLQTRIAQCCTPLYPHPIAAYITVDKGASIHKINCPNLKLVKEADKIMPAYWGSKKDATNIKLDIEVVDRVGMLEGITRAVASLNLNIVAINTPPDKKDEKEEKGSITVTFELEIENLQQLQSLIEKLKLVDGILDVERHK